MANATPQRPRAAPRHVGRERAARYVRSMSTPNRRPDDRARTRGSDRGMETAFGFERVSGRDEKQGRVNGVFAAVARRYDIMNDLMSGGLHRAWKEAMVARLNPSPRRPRHYLDMAGGTGDIAFRIAERAPAARVTVADISGEMLAVGRERAARRGLADRVMFEEVNAEALPYATGTFDGYTIAVGIRNVPRIDRRVGRGTPRAEARQPHPRAGVLRGRRAGVWTGSTMRGASTRSPPSAAW